MKTTVIALAAAGMFLSAGVQAQQYHRDDPRRVAQNEQRWDDRTAGIDEREARINARIQRGLSDGRINEYEARRLYRELRDVETKERSYKSDGRLNRRETEELNRDLDRLVGHVREQMRD